MDAAYWKQQAEFYQQAYHRLARIAQDTFGHEINCNTCLYKDFLYRLPHCPKPGESVYHRCPFYKEMHIEEVEANAEKILEARKWREEK